MICLSNDIAKMDDRQLRNEVQLLRDELAIMKRKFEDIIYNLDTENFSSRFTKEQGDMRAAIEFTAKGIKSKVSKEDLDNALSYYSTIEQTADKITATVTKEYVTNLVDGEYVTDATLQTQFNIYANGIYATVEENYETKDDASDAYSSLSSSIASVLIEAGSISSRVESVENGEFPEFTLFVQTPSGFEFTGDVSISGDSVVGGTITGASFQNAKQTAKIELGYEGSNLADFVLTRTDDGTTGGTEIFSIRDDPAAILLKSRNSTFLTTSGNNTYLYGNWNFSNCTSVDFGDFVTGGSSVAKFG